MKQLFTVLLLTVLSVTADADIWKWVDANGDVHFVESDSPIYTWTDEQGRVFYSDTPDHEDAVSVELIWVSGGDLADEEAEQPAEEPTPITGGRLFSEETAEEVAAELQARAEFCERATEVYDAYTNAPRIYKTNDRGRRIYLSAREAKALIEETRAKKDAACN